MYFISQENISSSLTHEPVDESWTLLTTLVRCMEKTAICHLRHYILPLNQPNLWIPFVVVKNSTWHKRNKNSYRLTVRSQRVFSLNSFPESFISIFGSNRHSCCHKREYYLLLINLWSLQVVYNCVQIFVCETFGSGDKISPGAWDNTVQIITKTGIPAQSFKHGVGSWSLSQLYMSCIEDTHRSPVSFRGGEKWKGLGNNESVGGWHHKGGWRGKI